MVEKQPPTWVSDEDSDPGSAKCGQHGFTGSNKWAYHLPT